MTRVAYDLRWVRTGQIDGIGRYSLGLAKALQREPLELVFLYHQENLKEMLKKEIGGEAKLVRVPFDILTASDFWQIPGFLRRLGIDIFFSPNYITSFWHSGYRVVLMAHDLIPILYRQYRSEVSLAQKIFYLTAIPAKILLRGADAVIVNSASTKKDLEKVMGVASSKVTVIYPGLDKNSKVKSGHGSYILYVGRMEPYKNLERLIKAYAKLPSSLKETYQLVIGGATKEPYYANLQLAVRDLGLSKQVKFLGFVPEKDLASLYSQAAAFVYPSLYEGFGLPVLEARAAGVPVITSNVSSLPEAAGGGAVLVDPTDINELTGAIVKVLTDEKLSQKLIQANKNLDQEFVWAISARKFKEVINVLSA